MLVFSYSWVFALLPLPWLLRRLLPASRAGHAAVLVPFGDRLNEALSGSAATEPVNRLRGSALKAIVWLCSLSALARPQWIEPPIIREKPTRDLLLLVDLSASMDQEDFASSSGNKIQRLTAVKQVVGDFLEQRNGDRVGLVVFGDAPYLQAPFSTDLSLSRTLLDECDVGMAGPRTALGDAIGLAITLFDQSEERAKTIIALTDGNDTSSQAPPLEAARVASNRGITIHSVAIGDPITVGEDVLDEQVLKDVASATGGEYFFASDRKSLERIYQQLDRIETHQVSTVTHRLRQDLFYLPLLLCLLFSLSRAFCIALSSARNAASEGRDVAIQVNPITGALELGA